MYDSVTITSQGQISIPVQLRRKIGLAKHRKALVSESKGKLIVEPVKDLLELRGSFKTNIKSSPKQIREAFENYLAEEAVRGMK